MNKAGSSHNGQIRTETPGLKERTTFRIQQWQQALVLIVLGSCLGCAGIMGIPSDAEIAKEQSEVKRTLKSWIDKPVEDLLEGLPAVYRLLDLGGGKVRHTFIKMTGADNCRQEVL